MRKSLKIFLIIAIIGIALAILIPSYTYVPPERLAASALLSSLYEAKVQIEYNINTTSSTLNSGGDITLQNIEDEKFGTFIFDISNDGVINGRSRKYDLVISLTPDLKNNNIEWTCVFKPIKYAPVSCR